MFPYALSSVERATLVFVLLLMQSACAPREWVYEADRALFVGDFEHALSRYEDALLSQSQIGLTTQKSALCVEALSDGLSRILTKNLLKQNLTHACITAYQLEQMNPHQGEHLRFAEMLSTHLHQGPHRDQIRQGSDRLVELLLCPLEAQWVDAHKVKSSLTTALLEQSKYARAPHELSRIFTRLNQLIDARYSGLITSYTPFLQGLRTQLQSQWASFWEERAFHNMIRGAWPSSWIDYSLASYDPGLLHTTRRQVADMNGQGLSAHLGDPLLMLITEQLRILGESLTRYGVALNTERLPSKLHKRLHRVTSELDPPSALSIELKQALKEHIERWYLSENKVKCRVEKKQATREVRYLDHHRQVISARYKSALKRVEVQQETLEAAQSQHEDLGHSLKSAHVRLQSFVDQRAQIDQELDQIKVSKAKLEDHHAHLRTHIQRQAPLHRVGPVSPQELKVIRDVEEAIEALAPQVEKLEIKDEISSEAKNDHLIKLEAQREEVRRLSGYLARTVQEIAEANQLLEEREEDLKATKQFDQEEVYSVFRYPALEHHVTCTTVWTAQLDPVARPSLNVSPPPSWREEVVQSMVGLSNRAFNRYGVKALEVDLKSIKARLLTQIRQVLAVRVSRWLDVRRAQWLTSLSQQWEDFSVKSNLKARTQDHLLTLLTYLDPQGFSHVLSRRLSMEFNLGITTTALHPFLIGGSQGGL